MANGDDGRGLLLQTELQGSVVLWLMYLCQLGQPGLHNLHPWFNTLCRRRYRVTVRRQSVLLFFCLRRRALRVVVLTWRAGTTNGYFGSRAGGTIDISIGTPSCSITAMDD